MKARRITPLGQAVFALAFALSIEAGERVQFRGSTSIELPTPKRSLEESRTLRGAEAPTGQSEYESGTAAAGMHLYNSPKADKKLKEYLDKKKNWIFVNPYKMQFDSKTEEFMEAEKGSGLMDHPLLKEEEKSVMEQYLDEKNPSRDRESESRPGERGPERGERRPETETARPQDREVVVNNLFSQRAQEKPFSFTTDQKSASILGEASIFDQKPERTPLFNDRPLGTAGLDRSVSRDELRKERDTRDAELTRMLQPRTSPTGARLDPLNTVTDATRQEISPIGGRRTDSFLSPGRSPAAVGGVAANPNAPLFSSGTGPGSVANRPSFDLAPRAGSSSARGFNASPISPPSASPKPSVASKPFVLPQPQRKF